MDIAKQYYKSRADRLIKALQKRQMAAEYFGNAGDAVEAILRLIPDGETVGFGGSMTVTQTGLKEALLKAGCRILDKESAESPEQANAALHESMSSKYYIMSSNALTMDGKLVNIDGRGNRLAALLYGPENVFIIAGMNKVVENEEEAFLRVRNLAAPMNAHRLELNTPCVVTGSCSDCQSDDCICCNTVVTRRSARKNRIRIFLVGEALGF